MNTNLQSYYSELGVQPDASSDEIRDAYRRLAKQYHPDRNRGDKKAEERFKRVSEAYRVLSDPSRRAFYHQKEEVRTRARAAAQSKDTSSFSDLFKKVFRGGFGSTTEPMGQPQRGKDLQITLELDAAELAAGVKKTLRVKRDVTCEVCGGSGMRPGYESQQCSVCLGIGEVPTVKAGKTVFTTCPNCKGSGKVVRERCLHCAGRTVVKSSAQLTINVPPGTEDGAVLTVRGQGNAGRYRGQAGDLKVHVQEKPDSYLTRSGDNLVYEYPLNLLEVLQGGEIEVPTPTGKVKLTLSPGLAPDKTLRVRGKGLPKKDGGQGDLLVRVKYHFPEKVSGKALKMVEDLVKLPGWSPKRDKKGFVPKK